MNKNKYASRIRWVAIAVIYAVFHFWYGGNGSPLTAEEVDYYVERATEVIGPDASEKARAANHHTGFLHSSSDSLDMEKS